MRRKKRLRKWAKLFEKPDEEVQVIPRRFHKRVHDWSKCPAGLLLPEIRPIVDRTHYANHRRAEWPVLNEVVELGREISRFIDHDYISHARRTWAALLWVRLTKRAELKENVRIYMEAYPV